MLPFLQREPVWPLPRMLYELTYDMFTIVEHWDASELIGFERGRLFEDILYRYCKLRGWELSERSGARSVRGIYAASGYMHESDGVIAAPDFTVMFELKYLGVELEKNELLIFNQKALEALAAPGSELRSKPLYRMVVSGTPLTSPARRFAALWGIALIEPRLVPLPLLHRFSGLHIETLGRVDEARRRQIWREIPQAVTPTQARVKRLARLMTQEIDLLGEHRLDQILNEYQRVSGDHYWTAMDEHSPYWLEDKFDELDSALGLTRSMCLTNQRRTPPRQVWQTTTRHR